MIEVHRPSLLRWVACMTAVLAITGIGCRRDMQDQPRYEPFGHSSFFADHRQARPLPEGTVARGHLNADTYFHFGKTEEGATDIVRGDEHPELSDWHGETDLGTLFASGVLG